MRCALVVTGRTEWHGLPAALQRLFPEHEFYAVPTAAEVESGRDEYPLPGFTSQPLTPDQVERPPESATELVARAAQAALGDRRTDAADAVLILEDVELPNMGDVGLVAQVMRAAAVHHVGSIDDPRIQTRTLEVLRSRVSFHFISPMVEGWFFGDPRALAAAGVPGSVDVQFAATTDPEDFVTDDPAYLSATEADCPAHQALPDTRKKKCRPKWLGALPRERHPKGYVQWLCRSPGDKGCTAYEETEDGGRALAGIGWDVLLGRDPAHLALLRAMIEDLEATLGPPTVPWGSHPSPLTSVTRAPQDAVLRNL